MAKIGKLKPDQLVETAESSLRSLRSDLEKGDALTAARTIVGAAYAVYAVFQSGGPDHRNEFEGLVLDYPMPLLRIPIMWTFSTAGLMLFWDRCERLPIFDDLRSGNPNRVRFAQGKVMMLASAERQSGSRGIGIQRLASVLGDEREVTEMEKRINPERNIRREGVRDLLTGVCGPVRLTLEPDFRETFLEDLTNAVMERVGRMSFFELRDMYMAEGGDTIYPGAVPLKLVIQAALDQIDRMVAGTKLTMEEAAAAIEDLRAVVSILAEALRKHRNMPDGYLDFLNPYAFTGAVPKGSQ